MKVLYDHETDTLTITFLDTLVAESVLSPSCIEQKPLAQQENSVTAITLAAAGLCG
jgi:uncharacterized protein YuzE